MKQLKAFTLIEMLVVLVLSALVFGIASSAWLYFEQLSNKINDNQSYLFGYNKFDYLIKNDINSAKTISGTEASLFFEKSEQEIYYQFLDTTIIRIQGEFSDTINIHYKKRYYFAGYSNDLIQKIDFIFELYDNSISKSYTKWYDNKTLLEHSDN